MPVCTCPKNSIKAGKLKALQKSLSPRPPFTNRGAMRKFLLVAASVAIVLATVPNDEYGRAFKDFETSFQKQYVSEQERESKFEIFKKNYILLCIS